MKGWDYGNARIRALRSRLLDARRYGDLLRAPSVEAMLGALAATPYRPDVERAFVQAHDLRRLDEVLRIHLSRIFRALPSWFEGAARVAIERLMAVWDWHNVRTILRGRARHLPAAEIEPLLIPAGRLGAGELAALARQETVGDVSMLLRAWGLPARPQDWAARLDPATIDRLNVIHALRLRAARRQDGVEAREAPLPGGSLGPSLLDDLAHADERTAAPLPRPWPERLAGWVEDGDLPRLERELLERELRTDARLFAHCDPLGPGIPRAYVASKRLEVRNLRCIGRGIEDRWPREEIEERLVFA
ncbi:MAG: V-type ATPase subunit [Planctomycetota bacterium]|jgi:vacuolar-type H+-ATPase subunit C/Vma6